MSNNGAYHYAFLLSLLAHQQHQQILSHSHCHGDELESMASLPFTSSLYRSIAGAIFDSAPSALTVNILTQGFLGFLSGRIAKRSAYYHPFFTPLFQSGFECLLSLPHMQKEAEHLAYHLSHSQPSHAPQLYLYSDADPLIPSHMVREFAKEQYRRMMLNDPKWKQLTSQPLEQPITSTSEAGHDASSKPERRASVQVQGPLPWSLASSAPSSPVYYREFHGSDHVQHFRLYPQEYQETVDQFMRAQERRWKIVA